MFEVCALCKGRVALGRQASSRLGSARIGFPVMSASTGSATSSIKRPSLSELFRAFVIVSVSGFGGALPWARRMVVEQRR